MTSTLITGARLIDPASRLDRRGALLVVDGRIAELGDVRTTPEEVDRVIAADGRLVCPGLIDLAARTGEPGPGHHASIASEARAAVASGITTMLCPPDTTPVLDATSVIELVHQRAQMAAAARVLPVAALTRGLDGEQLAEMGSLQAAGCPAAADGGHAIRDSLVLRRALEYAATLDLPAMLSPADPWLANGGCLHEGWMATRLGLAGVPAAAEMAGLGRSLAVAEMVGGPVHVGRLSAGAALRPLRQSREAGLPVTADVAITHLFLNEHEAVDFNTAARLDPPLRAMSDRDALRAGVADGTIDVICSDHRPLPADDKDGPFEASQPGASGLDTLLALILRLVDDNVLDLHTALARVTCNPALAMGLDSGRLAIGAPADIIVIDPDAVWWCEPANLRSAGHNSPFLGWEFTGRVSHTLVGGVLRHGATD